ncbi:MAG: glycosyltransferase family 4 protein [Proteobacteria bacterium]|nr:glycosyltransferase family 4 protein [Pseudomonadota bacterium]
MKVALVHRRFGVDGGTERFLEGLARRLSARGHDVEVFATSVDPRFARTRVATFRRLWLGGGGAFKHALLWLSARLAVRARNYDVVLHLGRTGPLDIYRAGGGCHRTWFDLLMARAVTGGQRAALKFNFAHRFLLWHERTALSHGGRFVVPSEASRANLVASYGNLAAGVVVLPNGVDLDRFHPRNRKLFFEEERQRLGLRPEELVLLFVGSDATRKGLDTLLRSLAILKDSGKADDVRLLVIGPGARQRDRYAAEAQALGLRDQVTFAPPQQAIERVYPAVDLLVLPTRHDPFANVTLESLACGTPVITTAANGAIEAVTDRTSLVVIDDPEDHEGFAAAIADQLSPDGLQSRRAAARTAAEPASEQGAIDRWETLLTEAAGAR